MAVARREQPGPQQPRGHPPLDHGVSRPVSSSRSRNARQAVSRTAQLCSSATTTAARSQSAGVGSPSGATATAARRRRLALGRAPASPRPDHEGTVADSGRATEEQVSGRNLQSHPYWFR
jgi:hypothetical protein